MTSGRTPGFLLRADATHLSRMYFIPARESLSPCRFGNSGYECLPPPVKLVSEMYWRTMVAVGSNERDYTRFTALASNLDSCRWLRLKSSTEMSAISGTRAPESYIKLSKTMSLRPDIFLASGCSSMSLTPSGDM